MARGVKDWPGIDGSRGTAAALSLALTAVATSLPAMTPQEALAHFTQFCGEPTEENAAPRSPLPQGWTKAADPAPGAQMLAEWYAAQLLTDDQITAEEIGEEIAFQLEMLEGRLSGEAFELVTDGAGHWFFLADGTHPRFKHRTCLMVSRDDGTARAALMTALPHVPLATEDAITRWVFDGGFGAGEDRQMYRRRAFVFTGTDGTAYWGLEWKAETLR